MKEFFLIVGIPIAIKVGLTWLEKNGSGRVASNLRSQSQDAYDMELENRRRAVDELRAYGRKEGYDV